jgi:predicted permease
MLTESVTLSMAGALAGFGLAFWGSSALAAFIIGQIFIVPAQLNLSPDWRVLGFTASAAILTGVLFGLAPAWRAIHEDPNAAVQRGARTMAVGTGALGKGLIVAQVALSVVLVTSAGLFIRSLEKLHAVEPGFRTHGALDVHLFPKPGGYTNLARVDYYRMLTDHIAALPGVAAAGIVHNTPASILPWTEKIRISKTGTEEIRANIEMLMPGAFQAMGISVLRGRRFTWQDDEHTARLVIVSKNLAEKLFPRSVAIGQQLDITTLPKWQNLQIVGIVSNTSLYDLREHEPPTLYLPSMQYGDYMGWSDLFVQTRISPLALIGPIKRTVESLGHEYVASTSTVDEEIDRSLYWERITALLSAFFGAVALLLAAIGLYGLMAYNVTRRSREIAIRIAVGAQRTTVQGMIIRETLTLALIGVAVGVPCGIASSKLIAGMLYGVSPHDPLTLFAVSLVLLGIAAIAGLVPARRAMRLDPMLALRCE